VTAGPTLRERYARAGHIVSRRVAGESILVPLASRGADIQAIYDLNPVGAFIWEHLDGSRTGGEVVRLVTEAFEVEPERAGADYLAFVEQLLSLNVIQITPEPSP
jgi:coenzyme PQQ synthesis protein D (PqqD)